MSELTDLLKQAVYAKVQGDTEKFDDSISQYLVLKGKEILNEPKDEPQDD